MPGGITDKLLCPQIVSDQSPSIECNPYIPAFIFNNFITNSGIILIAQIIKTGREYFFFTVEDENTIICPDPKVIITVFKNYLHMIVEFFSLGTGIFNSFKVVEIAII